MQNALLLLSPLDPAMLDNRAGMLAAQALKRLGVARADLTTQPRFSYSAATASHKDRALCDFTFTARSLSSLIFRPMLGHSDICDLSHADKMPVLPQLATLESVGAVFAGASNRLNRAMDAIDGRDIGLVLHLALHARPATASHYDLLAFPGMSARARKSLDALGDVRGPEIDGYGTTIDLKKLRVLMNFARTPEKTPPRALMN